MDISAVKNVANNGNYSSVMQITPVTQSTVNEQPAKTKNNADKSVTASTDEKTKKKPVDVEKVVQMTEAMNKFVQAMDANIRFTIHEKSKQLMVQVVDQTNDKVLKEFPSSEFLDTIASIRDYVGILLDKKI